MTDLASRTRSIAHESAQGSWRMAFLAPAENLTPFVQRFNAYAERDTGFARRREPPSGLATLVFNLGEELRVEHPADRLTAYRAGGAFYTGLSSVYAVTETDRAQEGAQVVLTPLGARRLLGFPLSEVGDQLIDPADLFAARRLIERSVAGSHSAEPAAGDPRGGNAGARAPGPTAGGGPCVGDAAAAGELRAHRHRRARCRAWLRRKHLTVRFTSEFGMAPKLFARVLRFDKALTGLRAGRGASWAEPATPAATPSRRISPAISPPLPAVRRKPCFAARSPTRAASSTEGAR